MQAMIKERFRRPAEAAGGGARLRPVFDDFHLLRMEGDYEYPRHQHTNYELILVERGPYRCTLNGEELALANGQALVIKPGDWHQDHLRPGQRHHVVHFRLLGADGGGLFKPGALPGLQVARGNHAGAALLLQELRRESEAAAAYAPAIQDSLLEALFWRVVRDLPPDGLSETVRQLPHREARREQIESAMQRHLCRNPTVPQLARELRMSPRRLTSLCRDLFGCPPARLLLHLKMTHAAELLRYRGLSVKQVSEALGFANPFHFSRVFRRHTGQTPSSVQGGPPRPPLRATRSSP